MNLFKIAAALTLNSSEYDKGLTDAEGKAQGFGSKLRHGLGTAAKVGAAAVAAVGTAAVAVGKAFADGVKQTAAYGDRIDKMSQKMGISTEAFQEWDFIMQHCGASIDSLQSGMKTLATAAETGNEAFEKLGLSQEQIAEMSQEELFSATIEALQNVDDETERTYLASQLLGRGATELGALFNMTAEDTEALRQQVHDLGGVMSDEAVKAAANYQDVLQNLNTAVSGIKNNLMSEFLPAVSTAMEGFTIVLAGNSDEGLEKISSGVEAIVDNVSRELPKILPVASKIVMSIATAITQNLPLLAKSAVSIVGQLARFIIANLPMIASTVITIIIEIVRSIGEALPELIPAVASAVVLVAQTLIEHLPELLDAVLLVIEGLAQGILGALPIIIEALPAIIAGIIDFILGAIPEIIQTGITLLVALVDHLDEIIAGIVKAIPAIITGIINALVDNLPAIIQAGIDLFVALIQNLPEIIVKIVAAVPDILNGIIVAFRDGFARIAEVGGELLSGLWQGIKDKSTWLWDKIKGFAGDVVTKVKDALGIHSPSRVFRDVIGKNIAYGLGDGIDEYGDYAIDKMYNLGQNILDAAEIDPLADVSIGDANDITGGRNVGRGVNVTQNIYAERMTPSEVFEEARIQQERLVLLGV